MNQSQAINPLSRSTNPHYLLERLKKLYETVEIEGEEIFNQWSLQNNSSPFIVSARNLAHYLAFRRQDLRSLQADLMPWGLSSLGRMESRVLENLKAVIYTLELICQASRDDEHSYTPTDDFFQGDILLRKNVEALFGAISLKTPGSQRRVKIMVTLPTAAATDYAMVHDLLKRGTNCVRINCAHDEPSIWTQMIHNVRQAAHELGVTCPVMMDLSGPKIRTGMVIKPPNQKRVFKGDLIFLSRNTVLYSENFDDHPINSQEYPIFQITCTVPEILDLISLKTPVYIHDGKIRTTVINDDYRLNNGETGLLLKVTHASPKGAKLRAEKGLNFPQTILPLSPLTPKDLADLDFVAAEADIVGYSFVQCSEDLQYLQQELTKRCSDPERLPAIVAKIETAIAVKNLPDLIVQTATKHTFGVMIARGDLAVEIGYQRLAEIQEEILWICESAHIPVIWATQVLESLVKNGAPSRGEMTDAAMAERAECVMLNKGPFIAEAVSILDDVLTRMETHQFKKVAQLRALSSW